MTALRAAVLALLCLPAPAAAGEVTLEYEPPIPFVERDPAYTLAVQAASGEENHLEVLRDGDDFVVRERGGAALTGGRRCAGAAPAEVRCTVSGRASHLSVFIDAGDRDDKVVLGPLAGVDLAEVLGGDGNDIVAGHSGADLLYGGAGRDWLAGLGGADRVDGGPGDDLLDGGDGHDLVTYATRRAGVVVDLAAGSGGKAGESDRLVNIEDASGGRGPDRLYGDDGPNTLYGGAEGRDLADGRAGDDGIIARRAIGGPGDDRLDGRFADCGSGQDRASRFRYQPPHGYHPACEQIVGYYYVITRPRKVRGGLRLTLSCPIRKCSGTFAVRDRRGLLAKRRYALRGESFGGPGSRTLKLRFSRRPAGARGRFEISAKSLKRDHFRVPLR